MPSPNTVKQYQAPAYYHVYNRGAGGRSIFTDSTDRRRFMDILERHLSTDLEDNTYEVYDVELVAYCLMGNHFHMLIFIPDNPTQLTGLMRSVATAYSMYFNRRHKSKGHLFQGIYKASHIDSEPYLAHISRYIHLNPRTYKTYYWSSLKEYTGERITPWINHKRILNMQPIKYIQFLEDYEDRAKLLAETRKNLAL